MNALKMPTLTVKWLDALRSGEYKQGRGCLRNNKDEFCCLGVAADVMAPSAWLKTINEDGEIAFRNLNTTGLLNDKDFSRIVPDAIVDRLHFSFCQAVLARLNDEYNFTFPMIAELVATWWTDNPVDPSDSYERDRFVKNWKKARKNRLARERRAAKKAKSA